MTCQVCNTSGSNMARCKKCRMVFCTYCAKAGRGHYPKMRYGNVCPYCGEHDCLESV